MNAQLPSVMQAKDQAKRLRAKMAQDGSTIGHAKSLELVSHQHGFRDWNALLSAIGNEPPIPWQIGDSVGGTYLSQPFTGKVISIAMLKPGWFRMKLHLDKSVDVVTSNEFSNLRTRIRGVVGPKGHSIERTSNGRPHLEIDM